MTAILLFCIAEEAKPFVYQAMNTKVPDSDVGLFWLVEKRAAPGPNGQRLKQDLKQDEPFETEFIGASEDDCQAWAMEMQYRDNQILQDHIAILDTRSARDGTVLMKCYVHPPGLVLGEEGELGVFPKESDKWYGFRIELRHVFEFSSQFQDSMTWPVYFGLKEELTDANGVFDVEKAGRVCSGKEPGYDVIVR
ncbi:hypothetical protein F5Y05DRAFT_38100 [Hypoxylon sp. FL0543]|nr:hypothetical protein F5Y05DRAFT_38100 [Hypoxylon sp. FL0543]